jgi:hypothetical protein
VQVLVLASFAGKNFRPEKHQSRNIRVNHRVEGGTVQWLEVARRPLLHVAEHFLRVLLFGLLCIVFIVQNPVVPVTEKDLNW